MYNLHFESKKSRVTVEDPFAWDIPNLIKARKIAIKTIGKSNHTRVALYRQYYGMDYYIGYIQWEGDGYFFHAYSGEKWRIHTDGKIAKLKKKAAPFGL